MSLVHHPATHMPPEKSISPASAGKLPALLALSDMVNRVVDPYAVMRAVVEGLMGMLQARAGLLMISGGAMYTKHRETSDALQRLEALLREREGETLDVLHPHSSPPNELAKRLFLVPILWRERVVGLFAFDVRRRRLVASERSMVRVLANQLAAAFGSHLHMPTTTLDGERLQGSLKAAATVQESLLPTIPSPHVFGLSIAAFTEPAEFVGGDYYDLISVERNKLGVVVADIQGKGIPAALFGNLLRTTTHFLTRETPSPAVLLGKINTILHQEAASSQRLFTMFYAIFDAKSNILTYSGSGHVSPIVLSRHPPTVRRLCSEGTLLGVSPAQRFRERSIQLASGDVVVYFTDGVTGHGDREGGIFGEERLIRRLLELREQEPDTIVEGVKAELNAFAPLPSTDDVTIVVTKVS